MATKGFLHFLTYFTYYTARQTYSSYFLAIPDKLIKKNSHFQCYMNNKHNYLRKEDIVKSIEEGGLNAIDFDPVNGTINLKRLQYFIRKCESFWFDFPSKIFKSFDGIDFLLRCESSVIGN